MAIRSRSASKHGHVPDRPAKTSTASNETVSATDIDHMEGESRSALHRLWRLADEMERELQSARFEYPADQRRIDRLTERRERLLFKLLPYENLQPVSEPEIPKPDLSRLTLRELRVLGRLAKKVRPADTQTVGPRPAERSPPETFESPVKASPTKKRDTLRSASDPTRPAGTWRPR
jgi:hypothetical protein